MELLDGLYSHGEAMVTWNMDGITLTRPYLSGSASARWDQISGARHVGLEHGYVQLLLRGQDPPPDYREDPFAFAVNSELDANRLVTSIAWHAATPVESSRDTSAWRTWCRRISTRGNRRC